MTAANALAGSASPYLLAHADDPVAWQPWGQDAVDEARRRGVPLFVSIGYATCHWCHVMARESFRDATVARVLNERFVPVKVDREEHPDVDAHFLAQAERFTRRLGWPLNVVVSAEGDVGFAGTYLPPEPRGGLPSFADVLAQTDARWRAGGFAADEPSRSVVPASSGSQSDAADLDAAVQRIAAREDAVFGGFGTASKFPLSPTLGFLADRASLGDAAAAGIVDRALLAIARSPLRDGVDGGVFRYATGRDWSRPHYERMLVDNAQLLRLFAIRSAAETDAATRDALKDAAVGVAGFLAGVLRLPGGGFASAQDSESIVGGERSEGGYYLLDADERARLEPPAVDDKLVAGHNGLAIAALAVAGRLLDRPDWIVLARETARVVADRHRRPGGRLVRVTRRTEAGVVVASPAAATLEDHGLLAGGLSELALATGEPQWARWAVELVDATLAGDGFRAPEADPVLGDRPAAAGGESASPSGPAAIAHAAWTLHLLTGDERFAGPARRLAVATGADAASHPLASGALLSVALAVQTPGQQLVTTAGLPDLDARSRRHHRAGGIVAVLPGDAIQALAQAGLSVFEGRGDRPAAHVCEHFACRLPLTDAGALSAALRG